MRTGLGRSRRPQGRIRFSAPPHRKRRHKHVLLGILVVCAVVFALFLPGSNGIVKVISKQLRAGRLDREIGRLSYQIDSLNSWCRFLANPDSAKELARKTLGSIPADSASDTARQTQ